VDLDDGVVDIDQHRPRRVDPNAQQRRPRRQPRQEPGGDRVELAHMPEGKRPQKRAQRGRRIDPGEQSAHPAMPEQPQIID